ENETTVTYPEIAQVMGLPGQGSNMGRLVGIMLGAISDRELQSGRPMLSAVAVSSTNRKPGPGFAGLAQQHGLLQADASESDKQTFWERERNKVYEEWRS
ncbi:MAG TPA: hypothetical protein VEQ36_06995, partial [Thermomicrobiales bacterium]|nr:hypothetical protein [Thermomicrobiales bacterium]